jgi:hypothetical protein
MKQLGVNARMARVFELTGKYSSSVSAPFVFGSVEAMKAFWLEQTS